MITRAVLDITGTAVSAYGSGGLLPGMGLLISSCFSMAVVARQRIDSDEEYPSEGPRARFAGPPEEITAAGVRRAVIIGAGAVGRALAASLEASGRYHVVGFVDDSAVMNGTDQWTVLGGLDSTPEIAQQYAIDDLFVAYAPTWQERLVNDLAERRPDAAVHIVPSVYETLISLGTLESHNDIALVRLWNRKSWVDVSVKRAFDLTAVILGMGLLAPIGLVVAFVVKLTSPGPVIFGQQRIGRFGKPFILYKFRTMRVDAEAETGPILSAGSRDPRLTPVGRWLRACRIDEIPQLWNIAKGEMSLIGPRPERPHFVRQFERMIPAYAKRHQVRPGITGLAQVYAGYKTDARDKLRFDLIYCSHRSLWLDLKILLRTLLIIVRRAGS